MKLLLDNLDTGYTDTQNKFTSLELELKETQKKHDLYPKYYKDVSMLDFIDVYKTLELFEVTDHAIGHAIKKLLLAGSRTGKKSVEIDLREARDTLNRKIDMLNGG